MFCTFFSISYAADYSATLKINNIDWGDEEYLCGAHLSVSGGYFLAERFGNDYRDIRISTENSQLIEWYGVAIIGIPPVKSDFERNSRDWILVHSINSTNDEVCKKNTCRLNISGFIALCSSLNSRYNGAPFDRGREKIIELNTDSFSIKKVDVVFNIIGEKGVE